MMKLKPTGLEEIIINRINKLFGSEHAVIRLESIAAASRVVFYSLAKKKAILYYL